LLSFVSSSRAILLGAHLADLVSAPRRWRDGFATGMARFAGPREKARPQA
jgi:hypothetical protein